MASTFEDFKEFVDLPTFNLSTTVTLITIFIVFIIFSIVTAIVTYIIIRNRSFNKSIIVFKEIGGKWEVAFKDRAKEIRLEMAGDTVFYLRKSKKHIPTPTIQTGRNVYWFFVGKDNEWINFGIEDIDRKRKQMSIYFLDKEMRYARVALQRSLKERYLKPSFWSVYGGLIAYTMLIVITGVMMWLLFDRFLDIAGSLNQAIEAAAQVNDEASQVIARLDNVVSGSGFKVAEMFMSLIK